MHCVEKCQGFLDVFRNYYLMFCCKVIETLQKKVRKNNQMVLTQSRGCHAAWEEWRIDVNRIVIGGTVDVKRSFCSE